MLTRDNVTLGSVYAPLNNTYLIRYQLEADKLTLHVPPQLQLSEIFADIQALLNKITFAHVLESFSFITCTQIIIKLFTSGLEVGDFSDKIFKGGEKIITPYFQSLLQKYNGSEATPIEYLHNNFNQLANQVSVVVLTSDKENLFPTREARIEVKEQFWGFYLGKLIASVFLVILIVYIIWGLFKGEEQPTQKLNFAAAR